MYIYADESGHSGRMIFNDPPYYYQGAILASDDVEHALTAVGKKFCTKHGIPRVHSNELKPEAVVEFAELCLDALNGISWEFHLAKIHKPYIATTKFVDTVFDNGENLSVPFLWYNHDFFRHTLCCLFDKVLTERNKQAFWNAYLNEDFDALKSTIRNAKTYLSRYAKDRRLYNVALDALNFVLSYPGEITILTKGRKQYKPHTPNMMGFNILLQATRNYAKAHNVIPKKFYHDRQSEFASTMLEYHRMFSSVELIENKNGFPPTAKEADFDLGEIALPASEDFTALQAVDAFMWLLQRKLTDSKSLEVKERLDEKSDDFEISLAMSELIVMSSHYAMYRKDLSPEDEAIGLKLHNDMEQVRQEKLRSFAQRNENSSNSSP